MTYYPRPCPHCRKPLTKLDRVRNGKPGPIRCGWCGYDLEHHLPEAAQRPRMIVERIESEAN